MAAIQAIYAHHVLHGLATFEEVPPSLPEMTERRAAVLKAGLPYLAAELDGQVVGYAYATPTVRARPTATRSKTRSTWLTGSAAAASAARCCGSWSRAASTAPGARCWR